MVKEVKISVDIPADLHAEAMRVKREKRISMSAVVREGMRSELDRIRMEDDRRRL